MGPDVMLKFILMTASSHGAIDFVTSPRIFAFRIEAGYGGTAEQGRLVIAPSLNAPLTIVAWMQMWLRLVLGLETGATRAHGTIAATPVSYRQVEPAQLNKAPAHNLEALMCLAPDGAGQGLTLNQYRERFTRLSVLGRVQIYRVLTLSCRKGRGGVLRGANIIVVMRLAMAAICHAPLRPD